MSSEQLEPLHRTDNLDGAGDTTTSQVEDESATGESTSSQAEDESTSSLSDDENTVGYCGDPGCSIASCASQGEEWIVLILFTKPVSNF